MNIIKNVMNFPATFVRRAVSILWGCLLALCWLLMGSAFAADVPQAVLDPPVTHFFAGQAVSQTVHVTGLSGSNTPPKLSWRLMALNAPLAEGMAELSGNGDTLQGEIAFKLPDLKRPTDMHLILAFDPPLKDNKPFDRILRVYPLENLVSTAALKDKRIGVLDSDDRLAPIIESLGAIPKKLPGVDWVESFEGDILVVDTRALPEGDGIEEKDTPSRLMEKLASAGSDYPVLVISNRIDQDSLDNTLQRIEIVAPGHPVFQGFDAADLTGWQPNGLMGMPYGGFPDRYPATGAFRSLANLSTDIGTLPGSLLLEQITLGGRHIIRCQLPIVDDWDVEPVCPMVMNALLSYLLEPGPALEYSTPVFYGDEGDAEILRMTAYALTGLDPRYDESPVDNSRPLDSARLVILDAGYRSIRSLTDAQPDFFTSLEAWVRQGGHCYVLGLEDSEVRQFAWAFGNEGSVKSCKDPVLEKVDPNSPLLWGFGSRDLVALVNNRMSLDGYFADPKTETWTDLIEPPVLARYQAGKGCIVFCGLDFITVPFMAREFWVPLLMDDGFMLKPLGSE